MPLLYGVPNPAGSRGSFIMNNLNPGNPYDGMDGTTIDSSVASTPGEYTGPFANQMVLGQPFTILLGMILLLAIFKFASEHDKLPFEPADMHIGPYNILAVGVTSVVFVTIFKVLSNRYPVPGLVQLANFI